MLYTWSHKMAKTKIKFNSFISMDKFKMFKEVQANYERLKFRTC